MIAQIGQGKGIQTQQGVLLSDQSILVRQILTGRCFGYRYKHHREISYQTPGELQLIGSHSPRGSGQDEIGLDANGAIKKSKTGNRCSIGKADGIKRCDANGDDKTKQARHDWVPACVAKVYLPGNQSKVFEPWSHRRW